MISGSMWDKILLFALPLAAGSMLQQLFNSVDAAVVGRFASSEALAAVGANTSVVSLFINLFVGISVGSNVVIANYIGKGKRERIPDVVHTTMLLAICSGLLLMVCGIVIARPLLQLLSTPENVLDLAVIYLRVYCLGMPFIMTYNFAAAILRSKGDTKRPLYCLIVSGCINAGLNVVFVVGFHLSVAGVALATVLATVVQFLWSVGYVLCRIRAVKFSLRSCEKKLFGRFWQKTVPLLINNLAWGIGFSMYSVIMGHLGTDAVAANGIANISKNLVVCFCLGLGNAGSIIVGNRLGADRLQEAKEVGETLTKTAIIAGIVSGLVLIALSPFITKMVDLTPTARGYLQKMLLISSYYIAGKSVNCMTIGGIFAAGGDSKFGMLCDSVTLWCIIVPLGCICAFILKLPVMVVYFVLNLDEIIKLPVVYKHYKKYKWIKNLT